MKMAHHSQGKLKKIREKSETLHRVLIYVFWTILCVYLFEFVLTFLTEVIYNVNVGTLWRFFFQGFIL